MNTRKNTSSTKALNEMRRVVAGWNAGQGIETIHLEGVTADWAKAIQLFNDLLSSQEADRLKTEKALVAISADLGRIASGDLTTSHEKIYHGAFSDLHNNVGKVRGAIVNLMAELNHMSVEHDKGDIDVVIDVKKFQNDFAKVAGGINAMVAGHIAVKKKALACVAEFGKGNFEAELEKFPGKKAFINETIEQVRANLKGLMAEINRMSAEHDKGDIDVVIDVKKFQNDFAKVADGINAMVAGHIAVKKKAMACVAEFGRGNFEADLDKFPGKKAFINDTIEQVRANLKGLMVDVDMLVEAAVDGRVSTRADISKHAGDYRRIVAGINSTLDSIITPLRTVIETITQVGESADQLNVASQSMASTSQEQASAVEEVTASVTETDSQVKANTENANAANQLVIGSSQAASEGHTKMERMVEAMSAINIASQKISKIIKVIDEIAFQTNLLALNAAVEAARAGQHGRGFAVVAQEVRNLAGRSAKAARETAEMIEDSVKRVSEGVAIAKETSESLNLIVTNVVKVKDLVGEIAVASTEQSRGVSQINVAMSQVGKAAVASSQQAEELASASKELAMIATRMRNAVSRFKLSDLKTTDEGAGVAQLEGLTDGMIAQLKSMLAAQNCAPPQSAPKTNHRASPRTVMPLDKDERGYGNF